MNGEILNNIWTHYASEGTPLPKRLLNDEFYQGIVFTVVVFCCFFRKKLNIRKLIAS